MTRLFLVVALIAFVIWSVRRARRQGERFEQRMREMRRSERPLGPPEQLVCGACGTAFEPDKSGWICPKCGK
jgi:rubrerythrin